MEESCYSEKSIPTYHITYPRRRNSNATPCFLMLLESISFSFSFVSFFSSFQLAFICTCFSTTFHSLFLVILFFNSFPFPLLMHLVFEDLVQFLLSCLFPYLSPSSLSIFLSFSSSFYPDPHNYAVSASPLFSLSNSSEFNQQNNKYSLNRPGLTSSNINTGRCINSLK